MDGRVAHPQHLDGRLVTASYEYSPSKTRADSRVGESTTVAEQIHIDESIALGHGLHSDGLVKATGHRFTTLPVDNPVGFFFEAMFQTGPFWYFIGFCQIVADVLLLIPATSTLGAVFFLPIGLSVLLVTWGIGFGGTVYITAGMLLSAIYLLCWDADKIWSAGSRLLDRTSEPKLLEGAGLMEKTGWISGGLVGMALLMTTRGFIPASFRVELFFIGLASAGLVLLSWIVAIFRGLRKK